jgi:hypothetical protein
VQGRRQQAGFPMRGGAGQWGNDARATRRRGELILGIGRRGGSLEAASRGGAHRLKADAGEGLMRWWRPELEWSVRCAVGAKLTDAAAGPKRHPNWPAALGRPWWKGGEVHDWLLGVSSW